MAKSHQDRWSFLIKFLKHPLRNASVAPSSRIAARNMLSGIEVGQLQHVVELGPGTGSFTRELYDRLPKSCQVLVIELDAGYVARLQEQYGDRFDIVQASAHELDALVAERGWPKVDLIISGLPFTLPPDIRKSLFSVLQGRTDQGTVYRWFTYLPPIMKRYYRQFDLHLVRRVWANLPPMWIYSVN